MRSQLTRRQADRGSTQYESRTTMDKPMVFEVNAAKRLKHFEVDASAEEYIKRLRIDHIQDKGDVNLGGEEIKHGITDIVCLPLNDGTGTIIRSDSVFLFSTVKEKWRTGVIPYG